MTPPRSPFDDDPEYGGPLPPDWARLYWATDSDVERWQFVRGWLEWCEAELDRNQVELVNLRRERDEYRDAFAAYYAQLETERRR